MHYIAFGLLTLAMLVSLGAALWILTELWRGRAASETIMEAGQTAVFTCLIISSMILWWAFATRDFSFLYVMEYSDRLLPLFYALTAFWAGQSGSFLFWALMLGLFGFLFIFTKSYRTLSPGTKSYFWLFFLLVQGFFLLLLTGPANPFLKVSPPPADGSGLNPLLQHPGMIFHPPILFMGYAGFTIPACLALATAFSRQSESWVVLGRNWTILSWIYLSVGILLGGWWSYMELGWGGYWAWDPVENASLIPWFTASALLHTGVIERQRGALVRTNTFLIGLTLTLCFFGTYVVRSGIIDSLHAFGARGVGVPLLVLISMTLVMTIVASLSQPKDERGVGEPLSRQGLIVLVALVMSILGVIVFMGTMWPVISALWSDNPMGLDARFYNRTCLPFLALIVAILALCPWLSWKSGIRKKKYFAAVLGIWVLSAIGFWLWGMRDAIPLLGGSGAAAALATVVLIFFSDRSVRKTKRLWGTYLTHGGLALIALGVAFSGPYQVSREFILEPGGTMEIEEYTLKYVDLQEKRTPAILMAEATLEVFKEGEKIGELTPQRRLYKNFDQPFAEVSVLPGLGDEVYATLLATTPEKVVSLKVSINPLVNWIWIGSTLMCLAAFLCLTRIRKQR